MKWVLVQSCKINYINHSFGVYNYNITEEFNSIFHRLHLEPLASLEYVFLTWMFHDKNLSQQDFIARIFHDKI